MKGTSINKLPLIENDGIQITINLNEVKYDRYYEYDTAVIPVGIIYDDAVDAILRQADTNIIEARKAARKALGVELTLDMAKDDISIAIDEYDKSDAVNSFILNGKQMWLPLEERKNMRQSLIALKAQGIEKFTYWLGLTPITMPVAQFEAIMDAVEVYALQCYNVTAQHKANVMALTSIDDVENYDYKSGYPEKLMF